MSPKGGKGINMVPELRPRGNVIKIFSLKKYKFSLEFLRGDVTLILIVTIR